jgi:Spy/CpxP family protein refolding chaperone
VTIDPTERNARIAALIEDYPVDRLRQAVLQSIDHAHQSAAEVAQAWAMYEGAQGTIAELLDENRRLRAQLKELREVQSVPRRNSDLLTRPARVARRKWSP